MKTNWTSKLGGGSLTAADFSETRRRAIANGWRSGLEESLAADLNARGIDYEYEQHVLSFTIPARVAKYTPDFYLTTRTGKLIIVETKGRFTTENRQRMILVKAEHPDLDIRLVFSNSRTKISKQSKTTYAMWCERHGFPYAAKVVPEEWLNE